MDRTRHVAVVAVLACSLVLAGCVGLLDDGPDVDTDEYDAEELRAAAEESMTDVDTYAFEIEQSLESTDIDATIPYSIDADGTTDEVAGVTYMETVLSLGLGMGGSTIPGESYLIGDRAYIADGDGWEENQMDSPWTAASQDAELLANSDAEIVETAVVDGTETIVLGLDSDDEVVGNYGIDGNAVPDLRPDEHDVESASVRVYVGADDPHHVYRVEVELALSGEDETFDGTFETTYAAFGDDVDIQVPEEIQAES